MQQDIELEVTGSRRINCGRCEARIADALTSVAGVSSVHANAESQRISVRVDGGAEAVVNEVEARLASLGYEARRLVWTVSAQRN